MLPFLLLIPGAYLLWKYAHRYAEYQFRGHVGHTPRHNALRGRLSPRSKEVFTASDYLRHLHEATMAARVLDMIKPAALAGDVRSITSAPDEVAAALNVLSAPLPVMFAQKDLNVIGAMPPLPEDGVLGTETAEAIKSIQSRFGEAATGALDEATAVVIRYSVGCINAQGF
jgi:hypothetical protein